MRYQLRLSGLSVGFFDLKQFFSGSGSSRTQGLKIKIGQTPRIRGQRSDDTSQMKADRRGVGKKVRLRRGYSVSDIQTLVSGLAAPERFGVKSPRLTFLTESLILAQNERWRRG